MNAGGAMCPLGFKASSFQPGKTRLMSKATSRLLDVFMHFGVGSSHGR